MIYSGSARAERLRGARTLDRQLKVLMGARAGASKKRKKEGEELV